MKTVLITGAGSGIGLACADKFLKNGWRIVAHYHRSNAQLKKFQNIYGKEKLVFVQSDFSKPQHINKFLFRIQDYRFDALVNNAAIHDFSAGNKNQLRKAQEVFLINTIVPGLIGQAILERMKAQKQGTIVNVSSIGVKFGSSFNNIFYGASKSGLEAVTRTLAREGAPFNILVNAVRPGVTDTPIHARLGKNMVKRRQLIPLRRLAMPAEIASEIYHLSAENTFMTNETIAVAGGE